MATTPPVQPFAPTEEAKKLYEKHVTQAWADQQAQSDAFDTNLLTYSSAALGLSIAFIKDIVPLEQAEWLKTLYLSWFCFAGCMVLTIASFQFSAQAQRAHTVFLTDYYLRGDETAITKQSWWSRLIPWCAWIGSGLFLIGIISTLLFASRNVTHFKETKAWQTTHKTAK